MLNKQI